MLRFRYIYLLSAICVFLSPISYSRFITAKIEPKSMWNSTNTDKLRQDLLVNYDKYSRPAQHYNQTTVRLSLAIRHIEVNEMKSTLTVYAWLRMIWLDEKLKWNPSDYGGLYRLQLAEHEIWQPDIFLYNSAPMIPINQYGNTFCLVHPQGDVIWVPPVHFVVPCSLNLKYWPFDTQRCYMKFISLSHNGDQIDILEYSEDDVLSDLIFINSTEWEITNVTQERHEEKLDYDEEIYPDITYNVTLSRISQPYRAIIVAPSFVVVVMILLNFWLPPEAGEKIILNIASGFIVSLFMLYFAQKLPAMGTHTPLLVLFYSNSFYIVALSAIGSILVLTLSRSKRSVPLPWKIKMILTGTSGKFLGLKSYIQQISMPTHRVSVEEMMDHQITSADFEDFNSMHEHHISRRLKLSKKLSLQQDWILLAVAIDRISFIFYCLLFVILAFSYFF